MGRRRPFDGRLSKILSHFPGCRCSLLSHPSRRSVLKLTLIRGQHSSAEGGPYSVSASLSPCTIVALGLAFLERFLRDCSCSFVWWRHVVPVNIGDRFT